MVYCEICEEKPASHKCRLCGRMVCEDDYVVEDGICKLCTQFLCEDCHRNLAVGYCVYCGKTLCEDCAIELDTIRYACRSCYAKHSSRTY